MTKTKFYEMKVPDQLDYLRKGGKIDKSLILTEKIVGSTKIPHAQEYIRCLLPTDKLEIVRKPVKEANYEDPNALAVMCNGAQLGWLKQVVNKILIGKKIEVKDWKVLDPGLENVGLKIEIEVTEPIKEVVSC